MKNEIVNKHDAAFKEVFSQKRIAKDFIENNIPKEALDILDMESLELVKDTFINQDLKESFSDLIYRVKIDKREAYICFLLEHKSYKDRLTIFQISKYIIESWMAMVQKENKKELPLIIPMLVYHGKEKWNLKTDLRDMIPGFNDFPKYFRERAPVFKYDLFNVAEYDESDFDKFMGLTAMMLRAFKHSFEKDPRIVIREYLLALDKAEQEEPGDIILYYGEIYLKYIEATNADITEEDIKREIKKLDGKGVVTMSILQKREELGRREGRQKGRQEGRQERDIEIAKNLLIEGMETALVVKTTGLSKAQVENLKEDLDN